MKITQHLHTILHCIQEECLFFISLRVFLSTTRLHSSYEGSLEENIISGVHDTRNTLSQTYLQPTYGADKALNAGKKGRRSLST